MRERERERKWRYVYVCVKEIEKDKKINKWWTARGRYWFKGREGELRNKKK